MLYLPRRPSLIIAALLVATFLPLAPITGSADPGQDGGAPSSRTFVDRVVLGEMFTATWCMPCISSDAGMDLVIDDPDYFDSRFVLVEFHSGDDYAIPESDERQSYYFITGIPTVVFDGVEKDVGSHGEPEDNEVAYKGIIDGRPTSASLTIEVEVDIEGTEGLLSVTATVTETLPLSTVGLVMNAVVVEDHDVELETGHILRMTAVSMPLNGNNIYLRSEGDNTTVTTGFIVDDEWDPYDLAVVAWVQVESTKAVLQAGIGYPEITGPPPQNSPPQYIGGDLDFTMQEDAVDTHISYDTVFQDPDGDPMTYDAEGSVHVQAKAVEDKLQVSPELDWSGTETVYISARDETHSPVTHPVTVTVSPVNDPPRLTGQLKGLEFDEDTVSVTSSLDSIFYDPDGDAISYQIENMVHLKVVKNPENTLTIDPKEDWNGFENLVVVASDGDLDTEYEDTIRVLPVNDGPQITACDPEEWSEVAAGTHIVLTVWAEDLEGDTISYSWEVDSRPVSVTSSSFSYLPDYEDEGDHVVLVTVSDGKDRASHAFYVTVTAGNRAPTAEITSPFSGQVFDEGDSVVCMADISDPDDLSGKYLEYTWTVDGQVLSVDPQFSFKPRAGSHTVTLEVSDGEFTVKDTVTFKVREKESRLPGFEGAVLVLATMAALMMVGGSGGGGLRLRRVR